ncbi:MAG: hypothetical protein WAQ05_20975 [Rubrivivax sp.]
MKQQTQHRWASALLLALAGAAQAQTTPQTAPGSVQESTDPARAAAIEKAAAELKQRPPQPAVGIVRAKTPDGFDLLSGGITAGDRVSMHGERAAYSLWIATVAKPSGAYLADVDVRVLQSKTRTLVLERKMEGPWLLLALPEGPYEVSGSFREAGSDKPQTLTMRVSVLKKGQRQAVLRFDSKATVDPELQGPFQGNPFGAPPAAKQK